MTAAKTPATDQPFELTSPVSPPSKRGPGGAEKYDRLALDKYYTRPEHPTRAILPHIGKFSGLSGLPLWECCAGAGHMARVLAREFDVHATDIAPTDEGVYDAPIYRRDFFDPPELPLSWSGFHIVTNPPWGDTDRFVGRALYALERQGFGECWMLLSTQWLAAKTRSGFGSESPHFAHKFELTKRIRWFEGTPDDKQNLGPMGNCAWFVWSIGYAQKHGPKAAGITQLYNDDPSEQPDLPHANEGATS